MRRKPDLLSQVTRPRHNVRVIKPYRDEAIVLCTHKLDEADRIITLLTAKHGQVRVVTKGVHEATSRSGACAEPFSVIDTQLHQGHTLDAPTQIASIAQYGDVIAVNYDLYLAATVVIETAKRLIADAHDGTHSQHLLLLGAPDALAQGRHDPTPIRTSYTLRTLALAGWAPSCFDCAACGIQGLRTLFSIPDGGAVYDTCRPPGASSSTSDTVAFLDQLLGGDWERTDRCEPYACTETSDFISSHTQWRLERRLRLLSVIDRSHP